MQRYVKILIVEDHALLRLGLKHELLQLGPDVRVLEAGSFDDIPRLLTEHVDLTLVLLDLRMPDDDGDGFTALQLIRSRNPELPVVVLTASEDPDDMRRALKLGARGFISKGEPLVVMLNALRLVLSGGVYIPSRMLDEPESFSSAKSTLEPQTLTPRQLDILRLIMHGKSNKQIARELSVAESTVKVHVSAVFRLLKVSNRTQAAFAARRMGLDSDAS